MLTICILILFGLYFRKPIGELVEKLQDVEWQEKFSALWQHILPYAKKAGRATTKPLLQLFFVVAVSETTTLEKALIYGCIAYVVLPFSILPRAVFRFLGILDETAAVYFVYTKIKDKITPAINLKVETTLDAWFGAEYAVLE